MQAVFFVCFGLGAGFVVISFLLGEVFGFFDFDLDADFDPDGFATPLKPSVIACFLAIFGGTGLLAVNRLPLLSTLFTAFGAGAAVSFIFYRFVIVNLYRAQNTSAVEKQSLIGMKATVTEKIPQGHFGKITYVVNGNIYSAPAKSEDGSEKNRNETVEIVYIEKNTYFVR